MIFQEPMTSLNPLKTIGDQIAESVVLLGRQLSRGAGRAEEMLHRVHISAPQQRLKEYPHQLSGGMRQRVMIAMGLSCNPAILLADEPTTALDVTVQAQILDLMRELQSEFQSSIMMITHNLGVVSQMADYVAVMYLGRVVEYAPVRELFHFPKHPYTEGLLKSVPVLGRKSMELVPIKGIVLARLTRLTAVRLPRCPRIQALLGRGSALHQVEPNHQVACWLHHDTRALRVRDTRRFRRVRVQEVFLLLSPFFSDRLSPSFI